MGEGGRSVGVSGYAVTWLCVDVCVCVSQKGVKRRPSEENRGYISVPTEQGEQSLLNILA